jgi:CheY-like chemotaxis protein
MATHDVPTVLVVDDEKDMLGLIETQLSILPFKVFSTTSPREALRIIRTQPVSVLVTDYNMPEIDGNKVLAAAQDVDNNIVSILATGSADQQATIQAINEGGIWKYIAKPWKKDDMVELVSEAAKRHVMLCRQQEQLTSLAGEIKPRRGAATTLKTPESTRYQLEQVLGTGGMGTVYKAHDNLLNMPVAVKVLSPGLTDNEPALSTLKDEARIAMQLSHRHIVRIHNLQEFGQHYFLVMEYVEGTTIRDILNRYGRLPLETVLQVVRVSSDAMAYAHRHHVLHTDLKPDNLMLDREGVLKVIDFGVSCILHAQEEANMIGGTPAYMSAEQIQGQPLDIRSDVYSMGITVCELISGENPFPYNATDEEVLRLMPADVSRVPRELQGVLRRAVHPERRERWPSVPVFTQALLDASIPLIY